MRRIIKLREQLTKALDGGPVYLNVRCMSAEPQRIALTNARSFTTEPGVYVNVNIPEHNCWLSNRAAPQRTPADALHKLAMLLDNYLSFCYGELYSLEVKHTE